MVKNKHEHFGNFVSTLESLEQHGLIDPLFKENILKDEKRLYQEEMKRLVNRRIYPHPQAEAALIESVIIQRHGSIDKVFLSYKQEEPEELLKRCTLHQLGIDKMASSVFEHYGILYGSENLTPSMALEGIKRAGIIDDEFKEFILFQEEQIRPEHEEKEPNEEEIARRFDCRYPVMADYVLTSNHWFYQPKKEEVPAKYSDTVFPEYTKLEL